MSPKQSPCNQKLAATPLRWLLHSWMPSIHVAPIHLCPLQMPKQEEASPYLTGAVTVAVLGTIAYRRPKALAVFAGMVALATAPYLGFMVVTINRFGRVSWGCGGSAAAAAAAPIAASAVLRCGVAAAVLCCHCCRCRRLFSACLVVAISARLCVGPALQTPSPTCPHSRLLFTRQFASKLVSTVETMDASGSTSFESGGWAAEGGGGDEWR